MPFGAKHIQPLWREKICAALYVGLLAALSPSIAMAQPSPTVTAARQALNPGYAPLEFSGLSLRQAQDDAIVQSPEVAAAHAKVVAATNTLAAAKAGFGPSLIAGYALNPQAGAVPNTTVTQTAFNLGVQATLLSFAQYLPLLYQAEALDRAAQADEAVAMRDERMKVSGLYYGALKSSATLNARDEALALADAQLEAAQKRYKAGDVPRIDVIRAEVTLAQAIAEHETALAENANAAQALSLETGVSAVAISSPAPGAQTAPALATTTPASTTVESALSAALSQRAELSSARDNVSSARSALNAARAAALPAITVSAGYEHGTDTGQYVQGPTINASFELPFNGSQSAHVSDATAALDIAREQLRSQERRVTIEVSSAVRNLDAAMRATAASTKAREAAQEELNATEIGYRTGGTSSLERTAANATYADARLAELNAIYDEALARAVVQLELGP